jgi:molybdenum cofactor synthesis domain-containing protein
MAKRSKAEPQKINHYLQTCLQPANDIQYCKDRAKMCSTRQSRQDRLLTKIRVEDAVGTHLAHDLTEIRPGEYKGPAFRKGHKVRHQDLCHLMRMGKRHLYVLDLKKDQLHEDDAVMELASALAGPGVTYSGQPREGKLQLKAEYSGLFKVNTEALVDFNMIGDVMCACLHNNVPVTRGQDLAGTRAIPLIIDRSVLDQAVTLAKTRYPVFSVKTYHRLRARLIITGSEVYDGLIEDKFEEIVGKKLAALGASLEETVIVPDDMEMIADHVRRFLKADTDLIITTGGMSVDPDDVTRLGIRKAGVEELYYGAAALPGAMGMLAYKGQTPIIGIPACGLFHKTTVFDLLLPRLLAGEKPDNRDMARLAVGGMCLDCQVCRYPACSFGKS